MEINQTDHNKLKQGIWRVMHNYPLENIVKYEYNYVDGVNHGPQKKWFPNGQQEDEFHYVDGKGNGLWKEWIVDGRLLYSMFLVDWITEGEKISKIDEE